MHAIDPNLAHAASVSRRTVIGYALGGVLAAGAATLAPALSASAAVAPTPPLPGEISRCSNQITAVGKKLYDNIQVDINGDIARIFVPQVVKPGQAAPLGVVWFYHGSGRTRDAMNHGFKWNAEYVVDPGSIAICQTAGGTMYSNPVAQQIQRDGYAYMSTLFTVGVNYHRATSGGGAFACAVYAAKIIPKINGLYMVNGMYDVPYAYDTNARDTVGVAFGYDAALIEANNPARAPGSYWKGANVRVLVSDDAHPDTIAPPHVHGLALIEKIKPYAKEASVRTHDLGHGTPDWATSDCLSAFKRWQVG